MSNISSKAIVSPEAQLAGDVVVGAFAYIGPEVKLDSGCVVGQSVSIVGKTTIAANTNILPMAVIGISPIPETGDEQPCSCEIGSDNEIREHVTIYGGADKPTRIGNSNLIMIGSQVGSGAKIGNKGIFANFTQIGTDAIVENFVRTSGFTFIEPGVTVGEYSFTAGYVDIDHDAPPYAMLQGSPFRVRGVNTHNLKQCGFSETDIRALKNAFREIFNGKGFDPDTSAIRRVLDSPEVNQHVRRLILAVNCIDDGGSLQ